ncbi:M16 family metallopeptidase [Halanaerobacter jeridensis]|uniref:Zinc protease n=1 Tax=Halanaerobacter jeridensis TaxID=706427 RepID=A0A938XSN3_9FIRM|nr:pitrilysin family protein [Halanaerobacter jeridensis]MBM7556114.1 zinc protease [Halanaerobacter jeridensis]
MSNKLFYYCSLVILILVVMSVSAAAKVEFSQELYKELAQGKNKAPYIKLPDYKRIELDNKLVLYVVEDDSYPTVEVTGYIEGGQRQEKKEIAGISKFMFEMMNTGTQNYGQQELAKYKELHGIDFGFSVKKDYYKFSGSALSSDKKDLLSLIADILQHPDFKADYYQRIKQETKRGLAQAKTRQGSLLDMYFAKNIYHNHPYSFANNYDLRLQTLANITPQSLKQFYQQNIAPNNVILGVVGDVDADKIEKLVKDEFASWSEKEVKLKERQLKMDTSPQNKILVVNKPDATQAKIRMGYNFYRSGFEDRIAFKMANRVYGGGSFSSRLMKNLRSDKGYVYSIYSRPEYNRWGGIYYVNTEVKPNRVHQTIKAIKEEMSAIKTAKNKITKKELEENINLYNALLPKSYQQQVDILGQIIYNAEIRGRQVDYVNQFITEYNQLTASEVQQTFAQHTYPQRFLTVIVANKKEVVPQFKAQGIDIEVVNPN